MLSNQELEKIINHGESDCVEFTASIRDLDKIRKAICAFANNLPDHEFPGFIFIGIKDDGTHAELPIDDDLLQKLGGLRSDGKIHPFPMMEVDKRALSHGEVAVIQVESSDNPPVRVDGRCWIRVGPRRAQASPEDERRLTEKRVWANVPYDMRGVGGAFVQKDLDLRRFKDEYLPNAVSPEVLEENDRDVDAQLQALRLTTPAGKPTVTAILILGTDTRYWFPDAYVQFVRFSGNDLTDSILDQKEINGTLPEQLRQLDSILKTNIRNALDTSGETHIEKPDYPFEALRELARNAIIHRNYENSATPVRLCWFDDRVEIINPGSVYGVVTPDNFGQPGATAYRNPTIAEAMKNMGFIQQFGIGIATARRALAQNDNPSPEFDVQDTMICTTIRKQQ